MRTDHGGEFNSKEFSYFCKLQGIKRQLKAPYSQQQNRIVGRRNHTIMDIVRSLIKSKSNPHEFWGEAVNLTVYLLNRAPTNSLEGKTPFEALTRIKPQVDHLRVFGCLIHVKILGGGLKKLDDRIRPMVPRMLHN